MDFNETKLYDKLFSLIKMVKKYDNHVLQGECMALVPISRIRHSIRLKMSIVPQDRKDILYDEIEQATIYETYLLEELVLWFKTEFFKWVDTPNCDDCNVSTKLTGHEDGISDFGISCFEIYSCPNCDVVIRFARYCNARFLLSSRKGRCSEWSQVFCLLCRAFGWRARFVVDFSDHVWVEVYSELRKKWIHCDPCEGVIDAPLMYEIGWKKQVYLVLAVGADDIQDVTWRYSTNHADVISRRSETMNRAVLKNILFWREYLQRGLTASFRTYLHDCLITELVELLQEPVPKPSYDERSSGSLPWRARRGEASHEDIIFESPHCDFKSKEEKRPFVWKPTEKEILEKEINIFYNCAEDFYARENETYIFCQGWESCVYESNNIIRKAEVECQIAYLCRKVGCPEGNISWKIVTTGSNVVINRVYVTSKLYSLTSSKIRLEFSNNDTCIVLTRDSLTGDTGANYTDTEGDTFETSVMRGSSSLVITAQLLGGDGVLAWHQNQLFRQQLTDERSAFHIKVTFI